MINTIRFVLFVLVVVGYLGMGVCDLINNNLRMGLASILLSVVQFIVFWSSI